ncbi:MFS transporter [Streptomyces jeddahensis]|uniref:Major facilitator superfamily protein n=1 Tax=Streptomyces jeddahensis TaxID=1716141 RepID=A0A177HL21_9ACTN|nr:MFS transporter [Streptomyces jeddahensis]OAH10934.1 major facilitator superfamily protein [Streptomyces jeddahensis]
MTSFSAEFRSPHFTPILLFVNTLGSFLVLVSLSTHVGSVTGSGLLAGAVLSAPWLPALLLAGPLNRLLSRHAPERLVRLAEAASLVLTAAALMAPERALLAVAAVLLLARGYFEAVTRAATAVVLRGTVPPQRLDRANTVAEIGKLTGLSVGAALAGPAGAVLSLRGLIAVNAATLVLSALLAWALPSSSKQASADARDGAQAATGTRPRVDDPVLRRLFARFLLVSFWQGFHTVAVTVVPVQVLGGGTRLVGLFVAVSSVALFAGSLAALPAQRYLDRLPSAAWAVLPMPPLLAAVLVGRTVPTLVLYALFLVLFEMAYVHYNNRLLAAASDAELPSVVTFRATLLPSGVAVSILVMGALCDLVGPLSTAFVVAVVTLLVTASTASARHTWRRRMQDA